MLRKSNNDLLLSPRPTRLFNPRTDAWSEHFARTSGSTEIVDTTPIGRATVWRLKLNRPVYKQHRRLLLAATRGGFTPWP